MNRLLLLNYPSSYILPLNTCYEYILSLVNLIVSEVFWPLESPSCSIIRKPVRFIWGDLEDLKDPRSFSGGLMFDYWMSLFSRCQWVVVFLYLSESFGLWSVSNGSELFNLLDTSSELSIFFIYNEKLLPSSVYLLLSESWTNSGLPWLALSDSVFSIETQSDCYSIELDALLFWISFMWSTRLGFLLRMAPIT